MASRAQLRLGIFRPTLHHQPVERPRPCSVKYDRVRSTFQRQGGGGPDPLLSESR